MARIALYTLGCKLNFAESATLARALVAQGHTITDWDAPADIYILNTCTVTHQADRKAHKLLRRAARIAPNAHLVVTGCYAQTNPDAFQDIPQVRAVVPNLHKARLPEYVEALLREAPLPESSLPSSSKATWTFFPSASGEGRTRVFLKVQDGCDYKCSFCTVPKARGPSRSAPPDAIRQEALHWAQKGYKEIVLTGINLGDYGRPHGIPFLTLLKTLEASLPPSVARLRLSSIEPNLLSDDILDFIADHPRWAPHFHLPLQSGSPEILRLMRRRYTRTLYENRIAAIRKRFPHAGIGVDVIVGFPGETQLHFEETRRFLADLPVSYLHVFPYSERPGTVAAHLPGSVPWPERLARSEALRELSLRKKLTFAQSLLGQTFTLLLETETEGLTENYLRVELEKPAEAGALIPVTLTKADFEEGEVRVFGRLLPEPADLPPHSSGGPYEPAPSPR
jgi:threonylcarbamoyladenosine tRNA methylthiotransferase MtaB